jgi:hypothetical protein
VLTNKGHINKSKSNLVIVRSAIKEAFLFKLLKELSLLLCLASSKKVLLSLDSLVCCRCPIDVSLIKR